MKPSEDKDLMELCKASQDGRLKKQMEKKSLEDRKREILEKIRIHCPSECEPDCEHCKKYFDQALTQLNALDKPRIDEGKLKDVILDYLIRTQKESILQHTARRFGKNTKISESLAHAIAEKAEEIMKYD